MPVKLKEGQFVPDLSKLPGEYWDAIGFATKPDSKGKPCPTRIPKIGEPLTLPSPQTPPQINGKGASDEEFARMHQTQQSRFGHPHLDDVLGEKKQRFQQLRKMGIIPTSAERSVFFKKVVFPSAQEVWKKSGDEVILLRSNPTSAADVEQIASNAPARRAAAADPVIKAGHQTRKDDFAYWRSLKTALLNRRAHRAKAEPKTPRVTPTKNSLQRRLF